MEITINKQQTRKVKLKELDPGECFVDTATDNAYMVVCDSEQELNFNNENIGCVDLENGYIVYFEKNYVVKLSSRARLYLDIQK